ncbi:aminotransferase class I/II-fold pyridoxal phosphate-dependent enzyme [Mariniflexile sp.]|uniref:aminotransferase class I/II-fold pyridoxal phosphate-dependent enzyme n=1 Tax=Mariniflexile sp. TaxID=1979402 RepID=UPI00404762FE
MIPKKLQQKLEARKADNALRYLGVQNNLVDFSSNDYLGFSENEVIFNNAHEFLIGKNIKRNGATGSRLLSGNHELYGLVEKQICNFHNSEAALIFNSGYDANIGFFSSVPQRGDIILYDEYSHASIRDGIQLSNAKAYKFKHNDLENLEDLIHRHSVPIAIGIVSESNTAIYIVTESVFSMDGDSPDLIKLSKLSNKHHAFLVVDEAHAMGVFGERGEGLIQHLNLENAVFARIVTFGKAMGCHGAAILGSDGLKQYLVNFARSFIYTTALPPHSLASIHVAYNELVILNDRDKLHNPIQQLYKNIQFFKTEIERLGLKVFPFGEMSAGQRGFIESHSAIHCCIVLGNEQVKFVAKRIQEAGFDVKPILSPTVQEGQERLRFCLHAFNSKEEITQVLKLLATFVK